MADYAALIRPTNFATMHAIKRADLSNAAGELQIVVERAVNPSDAVAHRPVVEHPARWQLVFRGPKHPAGLAERRLAGARRLVGADDLGQLGHRADAEQPVGQPLDAKVGELF